MYKGITENLKQRVKDHNNGSAKYSSSKKPYKLIWYCCFVDKTKALKFEKYIKHRSGYAFTKNISYKNSKNVLSDLWPIPGTLI